MSSRPKRNRDKSGQQWRSRPPLWMRGEVTLASAKKQLDQPDLAKNCVFRHGVGMQDADTLERIAQKYAALAPITDERARRQWAAVEAASLGWGGIATVADATGISRNTVKCGLCELEYRQEHPEELISTRIRHAGGGRKRLTETDPALLAALEARVDPAPNRRCVGRARAPLSWRRNSLVRITR